MVAAIGTGDVFSKGRDFGAWLGLEPKQISTGDRTILGKISRRGNRSLRTLFVLAAWVVLVRVKRWERCGLKSWIEAAKKRLRRTDRAGHDALSDGCPLSLRVDLISRNSLDLEFDFVRRVCVDVSDPGKILGSHRKIHDHVHGIFKTRRSLNL
jgi:hypothetical protein